MLWFAGEEFGMNVENVRHKQFCDLYRYPQIILAGMVRMFYTLDK